MELILPFYLARARYHYSHYERQLFVFIIKSFMPEYWKQINEQTPITLNCDLFENIRFENVPVNAIDNQFNYKRVRDALFSMNDKKFHIVNKQYEVMARLVEMPKYHHKKGTFDFTLNAELVPYFKSLAHGHIFFDPKTFLNLNFCSGRIYQILCEQSKDGLIRIFAKELKSILYLDGKYKSYSVFKKKVIDKAEAELKDLFEKGESKLMFHYDKVASKKKSDDDWDRTINLKVVSLDNNNRKIPQDTMFDNQKLDYLIYIIGTVYNDNHPVKKAYQKFIRSLSPANKELLYDRFKRMHENCIEQKISIGSNHNTQRIISTILREDYGYQNQGATWQTR